MSAASGKTRFAVMAFLALAWPSAGEAPGPENDYGRDSIGGTFIDAPERAPGPGAAMDLIDNRMPPGLEAGYGN